MILILIVLEVATIGHIAHVIFARDKGDRNVCLAFVHLWVDNLLARGARAQCSCIRAIEHFRRRNSRRASPVKFSLNNYDINPVARQGASKRAARIKLAIPTVTSTSNIYIKVHRSGEN